MPNTDNLDDTNDGLGYVAETVTCEACGNRATHVYPWGLLEMDCTCGHTMPTDPNAKPWEGEGEA